MKNFNLLSKKSSLCLENGSRMTRKWFGNDSGMTRFSLASLICLCMLTVGVGNAWGAEGDELAVCQGTGSGYGTRRTLTDSHSVGWVLSTGQTGYLGTNNATNHNKVVPTNADLPVVKAQNASATTSTTGYYFYYTSTAISNVGSIVFSHSATNSNASAAAYVVYSSTAASSGSATWEKVTLSASSTSSQGASVKNASGGTYTFTFNTTQTSAKYYGIIIAVSGTQRFTAGTITIKEGTSSSPSYTITATRNNNSYGTVSVSGTTITATPADCYQVVSGAGGYTVTSGTATVSHEGTSNTLTVTPSSDCTVQVNFEKKTVNTYVDEIHGNADIEECGTHDAPSLDDEAVASSGTCAQQHWHFAGWTTAAYKASPEGHITTAGTEMTANGTTYYAVWAKGTSGGGFDNTEGGTFKIYADVDGTNYYATGTGSKIAASTDESDAAEYVFEKQSAGVYYIKTGTDYIKYVSSTNLGTQNTGYSWTVTAGTKGTWRLTSETSGRGFIYRDGTGFGGYSTGNVTAAGTEYYDVEIGGGYEYSDYRCTCCTTLGAINGTVNATGTETTLTVKDWTNVTNAGSYTLKLYKKNGASWDLVSGTTTGGASGTQGTRTGVTDRSTGVTWSGITYGDTYKVTIQAIATSSSYCDGPETAVSHIGTSGGTDLTNNEIIWKYSIFIDDGTKSDAGWNHNWINSINGSHVGSVDVSLASDIDYYQFKLVLGGCIMWYGNNGKIENSTSPAWTFSTSGGNCKLKTALGGTYNFEVTTTTPTVKVTYPTANQAASKSIWYDNSILNFSTIWYRIGKSNHSQSSSSWTLVPGTDKFYKYTTTEYNGFEAWQIANNKSQNDGGTSIYVVNGSNAITKSTVYQKYAVTGDGVTIVPGSSTGTSDGCTWYAVTKTDGMLTHTATIGAHTNGTISLAYTDVNSTAQNKTATTSGLAHRTKITATATPNTGYQLSTFTVTPEGDAASNLTSGDADNHILAKNATFAATFSAKTYTITLDGEGATTPGSANVVLTYNSHDHAAITNPSKTSKVFAGWWSGDDGVGSLVIDASGVLQNNVTVSAVSWTDASGNWVYDGTVTLHAKWEDPTYDYELVETAGDIGPGDYLIVYNNTYALNTHSGNKNVNTYGTYTDISSYYSSKTIASNSTTDALAFVVEATTNGYSFYKESEGTYLGYNSDSHSTGAYLRWDDSFTDNQNEWTLGVGSMVSVFYSSNAIRWNNNSGSYRFAIYSTSGQQAIQLFKKAYEGPTIIVSADLDEFTYERGHGPSAAQSFTVKGVLLSNNVTVTAPTNYEVCLTKDGTYTSSVELSKGSGTLSTTTIYVRLASGLGTGDYDGNIRINSTGATEKTVAVEGTVTCSTPVLSFASPVVTTTADAANFTNTLTVTGNEGNGAITYTSSDASKASVDPATGEVDVKAVTAEGTPVTITATVAAVAGANCQNTASASYTITIGAKITWHVNGSVYTEGDPTTIVASGGSIEVLPTPPDGTATCGNKVFVGWTTDDDYAHATNAPGDLFSTIDGAPSISGNIDFYAVFATAGAVSSTKFKRANNAEDITYAVGQKLVIVDNAYEKILNSGFTIAATPSEDGNGCITVTSNQIWTLTEQDEAGYWVLKCGDVQLGVNRSTALTSGYQACGNYDTYASSWVINHTSYVDGASVDNCFYLWNWYSDGEEESVGDEFYNLLTCYGGSTWESKYVEELTSSNKNYYAMRIYVPSVSYTDYAVECTTPWVVTVHTGGHGSVEADPIYVINGNSTTLTLTPDAGYQCSSVTLNSGTATEGTLSGNTYTLTNITSDVDLTATFTKAPVYNVIFDAGQGKIVGQNATSVTLTEATRTYGVTAPRASSCSEDWAFAYWSTAHPESESNTTVPARTVDANQKYVPSANNEHLYAIYTKSTGTPVYTYGTDAIYRSTTGVPDQTGTTVAYTDWSNKAVTTAARYAGNSAGDNGVIQLRDKNPSGIVSTTSGGTLSQVKIYWDSHTTTAKPRSIDIYGYNTAYTSGADVYGGSGTTPKGTKLGTVTYDSENPTNTFDVTGSYAYVGLRPKEGALFLSQVDIKWITAVSGITTYYCHKPTCDECVDPTFGFETPSITLSCPRVGTYTNTFTTNNTNEKIYSSSNTSVATVNNSGEVTLVGKGTTTISVHQNRMTSGATKYCAVDDSYELTVIEAGVEVVEVTNTNDIIIEHDFGGNTNVLIDQLTLHEEGNKADEVFFSKYFEATGSVKLVALYNGTGKSHDPSKYRIRVQSPSAGVRHIVNVGDYVTEWPNGKELIFYSWDTDLESDINVMDCVYEKNDNGEIDMSGWIAVPWTVYSGTVPALLFGGDDAIVLEEYDGSQWNILDIIGALTADGKKADDSNAAPKASISWGDHDAWYCANGRELNGDDSDYPLATVRCLLVRKDDVLSGAATRNTTTGNLGTGHFNTLCSEWYGKHVSKTNAETSTCESFSEVGNFNYYDMYQKYDEMNTDAFSATNNADGTMTVHINTSEVPGGLAGLSCNYLKIKVTNAAQTEEYASVEYKVPIIVSGSKSTTDDIFDFEDCSICDVAILQGGTLTAATGGKNEVSDVEIYRGAQLSIPSGQEYTVNNLYLRSQGDVVPQLDVIGTLNRANTKLYFDKRVDESQWYWMTLPYDCNVADVTLRSGETPTYGIGNDWVLQTYDGRKRAESRYGGCWKVFDGDVIQKGVGYILGVTPKSGHDYVELRFPMIAEHWDKDAERTTINVPVMGTKGESDNVPVNDRGWNLVGNPYLTNYSKGHIGETEAGNTGTNAIPQGLLTEVIGEGFNYEGTTRYVNVPVDGGYSEYRQVAIGTQPLPPFMSYFIQVEGSDGITSYVQFSNTLDQYTPSPVRRRMPEEDNHIVWVPFNVKNSNGELDETTLLVSNRFTDGYDMMDDLIKWRGDYYQYSSITTKPVLATRNTSGEMAFNALPDTSASVTGIPVNFFAAYAGDYTFSINGKYGLDEVKEAQLWDATTQQYYNLLANDYTFTTAKGENNNRFILYVRVERKKAPNQETDMDNILDGKLSLVTIGKTLVLSGLTGAANVYVYDMSGKLMNSDYTSGSGGIWRTTVPATGAYFVRVNSINGQQTLRTIVK